MKNYLKNFSELKNLIPLYAIYQYINEISLVISQSWLHFLFFFFKI